MPLLPEHVGEIVGECGLAALQRSVDRDDHPPATVLAQDLVGEPSQERDPRCGDEFHAPSLAARHPTRT